MKAYDAGSNGSFNHGSRSNSAADFRSSGSHLSMDRMKQRNRSLSFPFRNTSTSSSVQLGISAASFAIQFPVEKRYM
jgi:hypothetical protein